VDRLADALKLTGQARAEFTSAASRRLLDSAAGDGGERVILRQLPPAVPAFVGRNNEMDTLSQMLERPGGMTVITAIGGTAGVGKTALAVHWAHQVAAAYPDGQLYVNLRGYDVDEPVPAADALAGFLRALGMPGRDIPPDAAERAAAYRSLLAGRRMLVLLDNAREASQVRPLLPGSPTCSVLITSRDALAGLVARDGAARLDLDMLPLEDAIALLRTLLGARADAEPEAAAALARQCCCLPLALRVAAELAATRKAMPLDALTGELAELRNRLDLLAPDGDPHTQVRAVFSWSCRYLSPGTARTFRLAALHPGADFAAEAIAALTGTDQAAAQRALAELTRACLIQQAGDGRYQMHDLLRAYAIELSAAQDSRADQREASTRLLDHYLHAARRAAGILFPAEAMTAADPRDRTGDMSFADEQAARAWLDGERANLTAVTVQASRNGWHGHAIGLSAALFRYLDAGGFLADALVIHQAAAQAAIKTGDRAAEAGAVINIGSVYLTLGGHRQAEPYFTRALGLSREAGAQTSELRALLNLSQIYRRMDDYPAAAASCRQALELSRATGDRIREARALQILGVITARQGRNRQAAEVLVQAVEVSRTADDLVVLVLSLISLAEVEVRQGHYQQARQHVQQAQATASQVGYAIAGPDLAATLGIVELREGRYQRARRQLEQALTAFQEAGVATGEADMLCKLGESDLRLGYIAQATDRYQRALIRYRETAEPFGEAEARNGLGEAALARGAAQDARTHHQAALDIAGQIGSPEQQARAHEGLGNVCASAADTAGACLHWQVALALYVAMETPDVARIGGKLTAMDQDA
jgi:tetratricopeptide (TPR) repeat protein